MVRLPYDYAVGHAQIHRWDPWATRESCACVFFRLLRQALATAPDACEKKRKAACVIAQLFLPAPADPASQASLPEGGRGRGGEIRMNGMVKFTFPSLQGQAVLHAPERTTARTPAEQILVDFAMTITHAYSSTPQPIRCATLGSSHVTLEACAWRGVELCSPIHQFFFLRTEPTQNSLMNRESITRSVYFREDSNLMFVGAVHICEQGGAGRQCFVEIKYLHAWLTARRAIDGSKLHDWARRFIKSRGLLRLNIDHHMGPIASRIEGQQSSHFVEISAFVATLMDRVSKGRMDKNMQHVQCILSLSSVAFHGCNSGGPKACGKLNRRASLLGSF